MSVFEDLFKGKVDSGVSGLFGSSNAVDRESVRGRDVRGKGEESKEREEMSEDDGEEMSEDDGEEMSEDDGEEMSEDNDSDSESESNSNKNTTTKNDDNEDLESNYYSKLLHTDQPQTDQPQTNDNSSEKSTHKPAEVVDLKESELEKAEKTVFVGNVPVEVVNSKTVYKQFKSYFSLVGSIKSIRFRSISFDEALPRKIAFVQKKFHNSRANLNAYIVYTTKEASLKASDKFNGKVFQDFHLRVDHITHPSPKNNKKTIFVGNLDFEESEETLWRYFNTKVNNDVESVRIVRDAKTNLGKGFALIQFKDTLSVNKALLLNNKPITEAEKSRKLRISRAKAGAKPSLLSPNHIDNQKPKTKPKSFGKVIENLNDKQKTKLGRANNALGKADKATLGSSKVIIEGERASKTSKIAGIKGGKGKKNNANRVKKPRIRQRSSDYKNKLAQ